MARIGLIGHGYLGAYVYKQIQTRRELNLDIAFVYNRSQGRLGEVDPAHVLADLEQLRHSSSLDFDCGSAEDIELLHRLWVAGSCAPADATFSEARWPRSAAFLHLLHLRSPWTTFCHRMPSQTLAE